MSTAKKMWLYAMLLPLFTFVGLNMCVWPFPRYFGTAAMLLLWSAGFTVLFFIAAIPAFVYFAWKSLVYLKKKGQFVQSLSKSLACLCFIMLWILAFWGAMSFRHRAFVQASKVGDQIVQAIAEYKNEKGEYPEQLDQLLPEFLEEIPYTGMIAYPEFAYRRDFNDIQSQIGEYELRIDCCSGGINFDRFIYRPSETYPDRIQGNGVERIRTWAYVHE